MYSFGDKMKIIIGSDHAGFKLKEEIKKMLAKKYQVEDVGTCCEEPVDYPLFAKKVAKKAVALKTKGIMVCKTGMLFNVKYSVVL